MANTGCCKLVGNFNFLSGQAGCYTSVSMNSSTEIGKVQDEIIVGPTIGNLSISAYASETMHTGCPTRANLTLNWVRKFDCDNDVIYFIYAGAGKSSMYGETSKYGISFYRDLNRSFRMLNASSTSGPAALYTDETQKEGYGLIYTGGPISIRVTDEEDVPSMSFNSMEISEAYLQSFSLEASPGGLPTVSYSFAFAISETGTTSKGVNGSSTI